ncbi:MAG: hypothetical protein AABY13_04640 [Nanoarchaeota archaeon]
MPKSKHVHPVDTSHIVPVSEAEMIQYIGLKDLTDDERGALEEVCSKHYDKIKRQMHNITSLTVHVKTHGSHKDKCHGEEEVADKKKKYSMHLRVIAPTHIFESEDAAFDIRKVANVVFEHMMNQIEHKFHHNEGVASKLIYDFEHRRGGHQTGHK